MFLLSTYTYRLQAINVQVRFVIEIRKYYKNITSVYCTNNKLTPYICGGNLIYVPSEYCRCNHWLKSQSLFTLWEYEQWAPVHAIILENFKGRYMINVSNCQFLLREGVARLEWYDFAPWTKQHPIIIIKE